MQFRRSGQQDVQINIAPLVDVVFLLVIFFAVSTTFLESAGLKLELPASSSTAERETLTLTVSLTTDGVLYLGDEEVTRADLTESLRTQLEQTDDKVVILRADTHVEHGEVVRVMDLIRDAGAEGMTIDARAGAAN
jgi:biopolymer transport protein ExbD